MHYLELVKLLKEHKVLVIANVLAPVELVITQLTNHVRMRLISQLIEGISRVLKKLVMYFNGTATSTSFVLTLLGPFPVFLGLLFFFSKRTCENKIWLWGFKFKCWSWPVLVILKSLQYIMLFFLPPLLLRGCYIWKTSCTSGFSRSCARICYRISFQKKLK